MVWLTAAFATAAGAGGGALAYRRAPRYERGLLLGAMCGVNLGTFAFPFVEAVWGAEGLRLAALYDVPNALVVFGAAAAVFAAEQREARREAGRGAHTTAACTTAVVGDGREQARRGRVRVSQRLDVRGSVEQQPKGRSRSVPLRERGLVRG